MKRRVIEESKPAEQIGGLLHYTGHKVKDGHCITCAMQSAYLDQVVREATEKLSKENLRLRADLAELTNRDERSKKKFYEI